MKVKRIAALTFAVLQSAACSESPVSTLPVSGKAPGFKMSAGVPSVTMVPRGRTLPISTSTRSAASIGAVSSPMASIGLPPAPVQRSGTTLSPTIAPNPSIVWFATDGSVTLFQMQGTAWNGGGATILQIPPPWKLVAAADLTGDDSPDLIWEATTDGTRAVTFMNGGAYAGSYQMMFVIPPEWTIVAGADFNADDRDDLVLHNNTTGDNGVLYLNGTEWTGVFAPLPNFGAGSRLAAVGDMNGDRKPDLITQDVATGQPSVYFLNGTTVTSSASIATSPGAEWKVAASADFNLDGQNDLVLQNTNTGLRSIWTMNGLVRTAEVFFTSVSTVYNIIAAPVIDWTVYPPIHFKAVTALHFHSCGLDVDGTAFCWGSAYVGQLGAGTPVPITGVCTVASSPCISKPIAVTGGHTFSDLSNGAGHHTCAIASDGAYCWGEGVDGQLGNGFSGVAANHVPVRVQSSATYTTLKVGYTFTCGLTTAHSIDCWGSDAYGQVGDTTLSDVCPVTFEGGPGLCSSTPRRVSSTIAFTKLSVGNYTACALSEDGAAFCWGGNPNGILGSIATSQCGDTPCNKAPTAVDTDLRFSEISLGAEQTCAISTNGHTYCWGGNTFGETGTGNVSQQEIHPVQVNSTVSFVKIYAGGQVSCGLDADGNAFCWGDNEVGGIGDGTTTNRASPVAIGSGLRFTSLSVGQYHTCGIATDGYAYCWGHNSDRRLGIGRDGLARTPTRVAGQ